jgi:high-affinity nickel-transport protein
MSVVSYDIVRSRELRTRISAILGLLLTGNAAAWLLALLTFHGSPALLGLAALAYSFGLRHAVDADHIVAIDNVTRKLVQEGRRPVWVGFFFSLGHATVVFALTVLTALTATMVARHYAGLRMLGGVLGAGVSALFLFFIAAANAAILVRLYRAIRTPGRAEDYPDRTSSPSGVLARVLSRPLRLVQRRWQMYLFGLLFGLGFDTATEVGLLGLSAGEASHGLSIWPVLIFPTLFAAGMTLVDSIDGVVMLGAYGWACLTPGRRLRYNFAITLVSVGTALAVGAIELVDVIAGTFGLRGGVRSLIGSIENHFSALGAAICAVFAVAWLVAVLIDRARRGAPEIEPQPSTVMEAR